MLQPHPTLCVHWILGYLVSQSPGLHSGLSTMQSSDQGDVFYIDVLFEQGPASGYKDAAL